MLGCLRQIWLCHKPKIWSGEWGKVTILLCFLVQFLTLTTWNLFIYDHNASPKHEIFHSLPLHENHSCQASKVHFAHLCPILIWRFCCSSHHSLLNSLTCLSKYSVKQNAPILWHLNSSLKVLVIKRDLHSNFLTLNRIIQLIREFIFLLQGVLQCWYLANL